MSRMLSREIYLVVGQGRGYHDLSAPQVYTTRPAVPKGKIALKLRLSVPVSLFSEFIPEGTITLPEDAAIGRPAIEVHVPEGPEDHAGHQAAARSVRRGHRSHTGGLMAQGNGTRVRGTVKWFDETKGYGFLKRDDGQKDVFMHFSALPGKGFRTIAEGAAVEFDVVQGTKGLQASNVAPIGA